MFFLQACSGKYYTQTCVNCKMSGEKQAGKQEWLGMISFKTKKVVQILVSGEFSNTVSRPHLISELLMPLVLALSWSNSHRRSQLVLIGCRCEKKKPSPRA